jgi:hypothetical protein
MTGNKAFPKDLLDGNIEICLINENVWNYLCARSSYLSLSYQKYNLDELHYNIITPQGWLEPKMDGDTAGTPLISLIPTYPGSHVNLLKWLAKLICAVLCICICNSIWTSEVTATIVCIHMMAKKLQLCPYAIILGQSNAILTSWFLCRFQKLVHLWNLALINVKNMIIVPWNKTTEL